MEELGKAEVDIPHGQWHTVTIELGGEEGNSVVVKQLLNGEEAAERIEAETSIPGGGKVGFGVGSNANFRFPPTADLRHNVGTRQDVTLTATAALRYHYDAAGRVVGRTLNPGTVDEESQFFIYDNDRIIQELDGAGNLVAAWDYGVYIDELLVMYRDVDDNGSLEPYYYLQDDLYNVVGLTDASGNVVERYAYDDYGAPTIYTGDGSATRPESAYGNPFLFQGRRWDDVLSLYDYPTRYYDPAIGRFLRIDTIGLWGDANNMGNPYAFVGNNPWSRVDPYGEGWKEIYDEHLSPEALKFKASVFAGTFKGAGGALAGVGVGVYHTFVGGIGAYTGSATYSTSDEEYNQIGEALYSFGTSPIQTTIGAYDNAVDSAASAMYEGNGFELGEQTGATAIQTAIIGESLLSPFAKFASTRSGITGRVGGALTRNVGTITRSTGSKALAAETNLSPMSAGVAFEAEQLSALNLTKNNSVWRPSIEQTQSAAFKVIVGEAQYTQSGGLPVGTILDATSSGLLEIKGGSSMLNSSYQMRLQVFRSLVEGKRYTIRTSRPVNPAFQQWLQRWGIDIKAVD